MRTLPLIAAALSVVLAGPARADLQQPGSLLIFPIADARPGTTSVLTLTNVNPAVGQSLHVELRHFVDCLETNRTYSVPSSDTLSVLLSQAFATGGQGFLVATAKDSLGRPVSANHLIGAMLVLDGATGGEYEAPPVAFASPRAAGASTDVDGDGLRDLDGVEYAKVADEILFPRFLGQSSTLRSELVLVNLTGGAAFTAVANLVVANDDRDLFVTQHSFRCWSRVALANLGVFSNAFLLGTGHAPGESVLGRETGWFLVDGQTAYSGVRTINDPALLAALIEPTSYSTAILPFGRGVQANGDVLPTGSSGDTVEGSSGGFAFTPPGGVFGG